MIIIYITNPSKPWARKIAKHLLKKKLIACGNILPSESLYFWKGKLAEEKEFILLAKTAENNFSKIKTEVEKIHPYETPCVLKVRTEANKKYSDWLESQIV